VTFVSVSVTFELFEDLIIIRVMLHSFFLSRVSHKGEFYLERFLIRQHRTQLSYLLNSCALFFCLSSEL
jgi:hypothetical protein